VATLRGLKVRILVHVDDGDNKAKIIAANETIRQLKKLGIDIRQIKREEELYLYRTSLQC
jgi:uncharacterized protein (UPF0216 family)